MTRSRAPQDLYGVDGVGVRRFVRGGDLIPPGLLLEVDVAAAGRSEVRRLQSEQMAEEGLGPVSSVPAPPPPQEAVVLDGLAMSELRALARERSIAVPVGTTKTALIETLRAAGAGA